MGFLATEGIVYAAVTVGTTSVVSDGALTLTGATASLWSTSSGALTLSAAEASTWSVSAGDLNIDANLGSLILDSGEATADAVRIISSNGVGGIDIDSGTGGITINTATTGAINIDTGTTGAINLGTGSVAKIITIGNTTGATGIALNSGSGKITIGGELVLAEQLVSRSVDITNTSQIFSYTSAVGEDATLLERIRTRVAANGNLAIDQFHHSTQAWKSIGWFNLNDCNQGGACELWNFGSEIFFKVPVTGDNNDAYFMEFDRGGTADDVDTGVQGAGWIGSRGSTNDLFFGAENNFNVSFLTSDSVSSTYPNTSTRRGYFTGGGAREDFVLENVDLMFGSASGLDSDIPIIGSRSITTASGASLTIAPNGSGALLLNQSADNQTGFKLQAGGNDRMTLGTISGSHVEFDTSNGVDLYLQSADDLFIAPVGEIYLNASVIANDAGGTTQDFRVETDANEYAFFIDVSANTIFMAETATAATTLGNLTLYGTGNMLGFGPTDGSAGVQIALNSTSSELQFNASNNYGVAFAPNGTGKIRLEGPVEYGTQAVTVADSADGNPATSTLIPTKSFVQITCSDADGCTITMGETGMVDGWEVIIVNMSANAATFSDTSGVSELAGAFTMDQYDILKLIYSIDRWVEISRSNN